MGKYNIGEIWWTNFPFSDSNNTKRRPAIIIDEDRIAVLTMYVTSKDKENPFSVEITDWKEAGLTVQSWARIDRIISIDEWRIDQKIGKLTDRDLLKFLQLIAEFNTKEFHEFSLIALCLSDGRFLQSLDKRWSCWLFPYFRSSENNLESVDKKISEQLHMEISTTYVAHANHCKYSVSDEVYKIYHHKLYKVLLEDIPKNMQSEEFELDGRQYKWMSITDMEKDSEIMDKNDDIVAFVKTKCNV